MKHTSDNGHVSNLFYRVLLGTRWLGPKSTCRSFGNTREKNTISHIYVINLDRQTRRWQRTQRELRRIKDESRTPLANMTDRFSAIDAAAFTSIPSSPDLHPEYSLSDQLFVEPAPLLQFGEANSKHVVKMTRQEIAIAMSHIQVWKEIASSEHSYTLILEDDVYFCRGFARELDSVWLELTETYGQQDAFDVLYLSYEESKSGVEKHDVSKRLYRPLRGLWFLSGYVLSRRGANALLKLLPVRGPVDLWLNRQFQSLDVFATSRPIINQRSDGGSNNSYSILPVLSKVGVISEESPSLFKSKLLRKPVFAVGVKGTGVTSLAMALSMLGYRCCSDIKELPEVEHRNLFSLRRPRIFDAYCNIEVLGRKELTKLASLHKDACFIVTVNEPCELDFCNSDRLLPQIDGQGISDTHVAHRDVIAALMQLTDNVLVLSSSESNKWEVLCKFLECEVPICEYPDIDDRKPRRLASTGNCVGQEQSRIQFLTRDESPWIIPATSCWNGIHFEEPENRAGKRTSKRNFIKDDFRQFDNRSWRLLSETFPSNLALFEPDNFSVGQRAGAMLTVKREAVGVRSFTSASIGSRSSFLYGTFTAEIRPANTRGLITGVFLHRNSPRQEIDIEFLGKDTSKLLVNVYYNPGTDGSRYDYGYRGTPAIVDLGFDASRDFHRYTIEWSEHSIRWLVDETQVHVRRNWNPSPIPQLPLHFFVNLWPSRSEELAGKLDERTLPATTEIKSIEIKS